MEYVIDNEIRVSNNSWGGAYFSQSLYDAIAASQAVGHIFVTSAGNTSDNIDDYPHYPASYNLPNIISVAATDNQDLLAVFPSGNTSCYGPEDVDLGAPGLYIWSTMPANSYGYMSGTSMATPHVTGTVGLVMSRRPDWAWTEVKQLIMAAVRPVDSLIGITVTGGVLSAAKVDDCNSNGIPDDVDIAGGASADCTGNGIPDECEPDCNNNGIADSCDLNAGTSEDCNGNQIPDECLSFEFDCNDNGVPDECDITSGTSEDCNDNGAPDECEPQDDCQPNGVQDICDIANGTSEDCNSNDVPDECDPQDDCQPNGVQDICDIAGGTSEDCNSNDVPDECEPQDDCQPNGVQDICDIAAGTSEDCNDNQIPDECDIAAGTSEDCNDNGTPDECEPQDDCQPNDVQDICDIAAGTSEDCNDNQIPDECDIATGTSEDCNSNDVPDECDPQDDCQPNGVQDICDIAGGTSEDCNSNDVPDECEPQDDCQPNGVQDICDIGAGSSGDCNRNSVPDECDLAVGNSVDCNGNDVLDECEFADDCNANGVRDICDIANGVSEDCDGNQILDECQSDCNSNMVADACDIGGGASADVNGNGVPDECEFVVFVAGSATGANNGNSWADAYNDLQDALEDSRTTEIWVAGGVYRAAWPGGDRMATFALRNGVTLYGGFSGGENMLAERDFVGNETILSGDLNADDQADRVGNAGEGTDCCTWHDAPGCDVSACEQAVCAVRASCCNDSWNDSCAYLAQNDLCCDLCTVDNHCDNSLHVVTGSGTDASAVLDGFTIRDGHANRQYTSDNAGGAMVIASGNPTIVNCTFVNNKCIYMGGAVYNTGGSNPTLTNCVFSANEASAGGAMFIYESSPTLINCVFTGNNARWGGAFYSWWPSSATLINCTVTGNTARAVGGIFEPDMWTLTNCIVWGNTSEDSDDEVAQIGYGDPVINYSCIQGWTGNRGGIGNFGSAPGFLDVAGEDGVAGTIDDNLRLSLGSPCVDAGSNVALPAGVAVDVEGNARFIDDLLTRNSGFGTPPLVDMGAYEYSASDCNNNGINDLLDIAAGTSEDCNDNQIPDECELATGTGEDCNDNQIPDECDIFAGTSEDCNENDVPDECDPQDDCQPNSVQDICDIATGTSEDCNENGIPDECDIAAGTSEDCNDNGIPDDCDIAAGTSEDCDGDGIPAECEPDCNNNGEADSCDITTGVSEDCNGNGVPDECDIIEGGLATDCNNNGTSDFCDVRDGLSPDENDNGYPDECEPPVVFVDQNATGLNNGQSWTDAFANPQGALAIAAIPSTLVQEVWVAAGTYVPTVEQEPGYERSATFQLASGVGVYGGFAGDETSRDQRDPALNVTVLSGDLNGDDGPGFANNEDNAWHVVTAIGSSANTVLDGFTITAGNANDDSGGGMFIQGGSPTLVDLIIAENTATHGGGGATIFLYANPTLINCTFIGNIGSDGGGVSIGQSDATLINCTFIDNQAVAGGGGGVRLSGVQIGQSDATLINCSFIGNTGRWGGGVQIHQSDATLINCTFIENRALILDGGAVDLYYRASAAMINCMFGGNFARRGGAVNNYASNLTATNCTFSGNDADSAVGGLWSFGISSAIQSSTTLNNCVFWGNSDSIGTGESAQVAYMPGDATLDINHSCVMGWTGGLGGSGNIGDDPLFTDADGLDDILGTLDDDTHPLPGSPCINTGNNTTLPADAFDLDEDGDTSEAIPIDLDGGYRIVHEIVDMGAYECSVDCNNNGIHDLLDIAAGTSGDCNDNSTPDECEPPDDCQPNSVQDMCDIASGTSEDCNGNGIPDECDIAAGTSEDCNDNQILDECELTTGTSEDCNNNQILDECELDAGTSEDCNDNQIPDECDIAAGTSEDCNGNGWPDLCDIDFGISPDGNLDGIPDDCENTGVWYEKNRYISLLPSPPGELTAIRVTLTDLPAPFESYENTRMWVGPVMTRCENSGQSDPPPGGCGPAWNPDGPPLDFKTANLQDTQHCMDFGAVGPLHVTGFEIVPGARYDVQTIKCADDPGNEANYSTPMPIHTSKWGDVCHTFDGTHWTMPNGTSDVTLDVTACLDKFKNLPGAPLKTRCDLEPELVDQLINITDITHILDAFKGGAYPFVPEPD